MGNIFDIFKELSAEKASSQAPIEYIIVGLGNPGDKYYLTRHNVGFLSLDYISQKCNAKIDRIKFKAIVGEGRIGEHRVLFMKPQTFMNNSGEAVREAAAFYKIPPERVIVISDDISLDVARLRIRKKGSDGGHNGLKSIILHLSSDAFPRIKVGVGQKPHPDYDLASWVLSDFNEQERKQLFDSFGKIYDGLCLMLDGKFDDAMQVCNTKN